MPSRAACPLSTSEGGPSWRRTTIRPGLTRHGWLVVLELTEDVAVSDYSAFRAGIETLGPDVMLAVDDAGAGFASFRHILELKPQFVKLDGSIVRGITTNPAKQALVAGL